MRPTPRALSHSLPPSKEAWLRRQVSDPYVRERLSNPANYRSRSAFKLIQLHSKWGRFLEQADVKRVVDLGAAPGGWSQVVASKLGWVHHDSGGARQRNVDPKLSKQDHGDQLESGFWSDAFDEPFFSNQKLVGRGKIVAVDLLAMESIPGVVALQADFLSDETSTVIQKLLTAEDNPDGKADVILSDMAANMSGIRVRDAESSLDICNAVIQFTLKNLRSARDIGRTYGGVLILKHFAHPLLQEFRTKCLMPVFRYVHYVKPDASRSESSEGYWLCRGFK